MTDDYLTEARELLRRFVELDQDQWTVPLVLCKEAEAFLEKTEGKTGVDNPDFQAGFSSGYDQRQLDEHGFSSSERALWRTLFACLTKPAHLVTEDDVTKAASAEKQLRELGMLDCVRPLTDEEREKASIERMRRDNIDRPKR